MADGFKKITTWDKGLVTALGDKSIPSGTASRCDNFYELGDRVELAGGSQLVGDESAGTSVVWSSITGISVAGDEVTFKKVGTKVQFLDDDTDAWVDVQTGLADEDMTFFTYRTPAGSFVFFTSPNNGVWRVNLANPTTARDFYDPLVNYKGYATIDTNRMRMWGIAGSETVIRRSKIDGDFPYASVASEAVGTGNGVQVTFTGTLANPLVTARSLSITDGTETFTDQSGDGTLVGSLGGTGALNYTTGAFSVTFAAAPANLQALTAGYQHEDPNSGGVTDFRFSTPRLAGEGDFFFQGQNSSGIRCVSHFEGVEYCAHRNITWFVTTTSDDLNASNEVFRQNLGTSSLRGMISTNDGIYIADDSNPQDKKIRLVKNSDLNDKVLPLSISDQLDLSSLDFSECAFQDDGELLHFACKSSADAGFNDVRMVYNTIWKNWVTGGGQYRCFTKRGGVVVGGSSINENMYTVDDGLDDDDGIVEGEYVSNDDTLDTEDLKRCKRLVLEGEIDDQQSFTVSLSLDGDEFVDVGTVDGSGPFVDRGAGTEYGVAGYGVDGYGTDEVRTKFPYMAALPLRLSNSLGKFYRARFRIRNTKFGYLSFRTVRWDKVRRKRLRLPSKFRGEA